MPTQFPATFELSNLNGANGFKINGIAAGDQSGIRVSFAGDLNADGYPDVLIAADGASPGGRLSAGQAYVIFGGVGVSNNGVVEASDLDGSNGFLINGINLYDELAVVSGAGDFNDDGVDDLITGAARADPNGGNSGQSYVVFGGSSVGDTGIVELSNLSGANGFRLNGIAAVDKSGISVNQAGDVNDDGINDLIIGADRADPNGLDSGQSYVVFGGSSVGDTGTVELSNLSGANGFRLNGIAASDFSGRSVSPAGDINNDGVVDFIIAALRASPNGIASGQSYVIFGGSSVGSTGIIELSNLSGANGFRLNGIAASDRSGISVNQAGDINGDGVNDLIIGAYQANPNGADSGQSYVVFGGSSVGSTGTIELSNLTGVNGFEINGIEANDRSGCSVSQAGDINADGIGDLIIGAYQADPNGSESGQSYVVFGGLSVGSSGTVELSSLNGVNGFEINGIAANDYSGLSVSSAGDVNGDGVDDFIIGAYHAGPNGGNSGQSYVIFGETLAVVNNELSINEGQNTAVSSASLSAKNTWTPDNTLIFQPFNVTHGQFELALDPNVAISTFTQQQVIDLQIRFRHDGSEFPPNYSMGVANTAGVIRTPEPASITYSSSNNPPQIIENRLTLSEGETVLITANDILIVDSDNNPENLLITVSQVKQGHFALIQMPLIPITQFVQNQITQGSIVFVHNGGEQGPSFDLSVSDGSITVGPKRADIFFTPVDDVPVLETNNLNINQGERLIINSGNLRATDPDTPAFNLVFAIENGKHGQFERFSNPGAAITEFRQQSIFDGDIRFAHDGSQFPPSYNVTVGDGKSKTVPSAVNVNYSLSKAGVVVSQKSNTVRNAIIGSVVSGFVGLVFLAAKIYIKRKSDKQMTKALEGDTESAAGQRAQYFKEVISPVAKKVLGKFSIKNFFGISDKKLGEFLDAVAKLVEECRARGVPVNDLPNMEPANATSLINEIAKQTKQVLAPTSSITGTMMNFFKRQITPQQIEDASVMIASFVKTAWDSTVTRARSYSQAQGVEMTALGSGASAFDVGQNNPIFGSMDDLGAGVAAGATTTFTKPSEYGNIAELMAGFKEEFTAKLEESNQQILAENAELKERLEQLEGKQNLPPPLKI